jgi:hypothetical protein
MNRQVNKANFQVARFEKYKTTKTCMRIYFDVLLRF